MRKLLIVAIVLAVGVGWAGQLLAADAGLWPPVPDVGPHDTGWRGPGFYLSPVKVGLSFIVFLLWVRTTDWVSRDCQMYNLDYLKWNPIVFGTFMGAQVLLWLLPTFWIGFPLLLAAYVAPLATYIVQRNGQVEQHQKVLTKEHLRHWFSGRAKKVGVKMDAERAAGYTTGVPLTLRGINEFGHPADTSHLLAARQHPGFNLAREMLAEGLSHRATSMIFDYTAQTMAARYLVDGVWHKGQNRERESADPALEAIKMLCGANAAERQQRQEGRFTGTYQSSNFVGSFASQGVKTGERVVLQFEGEKVEFKSLDELGMRPKMQEQLKEQLNLQRGLILLSAPPAGGLRTSTNVVLRSTDRLMREFLGVEERNNRYEEVENIPITTYDAAEGQTPVDVLPKVFRQQPNCFVLRDLVNAETVSLLCQQIEEDDGILAFSTVRAKECAEALLRVLALKVPPAEFAPNVRAVLCQRLIRKLCDQCKEPYMPTQQVLQQLGIPQGHTRPFFRPPQRTEEEEVCQNCGGIGYRGRTALFEMMVVDDTVREVLTTSPKIELVRKAGKKAGMATFQDEGLLMVAKGVTSLPELMRVLKQ